MAGAADGHHPAAVVDASTVVAGRVAAKSAVGDSQRRAAIGAIIIDAAAAADHGGSADRVTAKSAVGDSQRRAAVEAIVVDAATAPAGGIAAERALIDGQCSVIVVNAGAAHEPTHWALPFVMVRPAMVAVTPLLT